MSTALTRAFIAASFCAAVAISSQGAFAADTLSMTGREPIKFEYRFKPSDLTTDHGTQHVYLNLVRKARRACSEESAPMHDLNRADRRCVADLVSSVVSRIGSPTLAKLYQNDQSIREI